MRGEYVCDMPSKTWVSAIQYAIENIARFSICSDKMQMLWIVNGGHIRRHLSNDILVLAWLKLVMPKYDGGELQLYRGECQFLYDQGLIGFCWTPNKHVAEKFARCQNAIESGGVLLSAKFAPDAILSSPNSHSNWLGEHEYTCDPTKIGSIDVLHRYPKTF